MNIAGYETPLLLLDKIKLDKNIIRAENQIKQLAVAFRHNTHTCRSVDILSRFCDAKPGRLSLSTLKEAEYYFAHGYHDFIYTVSIAPNKLERAIRLVKRGANLKLVVNCEQQILQCALSARAQSCTLKLMLAVTPDTWHHGADSKASEIIQLARIIQEHRQLEFAGLFTEDSFSYVPQKHRQAVPAHFLRAAREEENQLAFLNETLRHHGIKSPILSAGSTRSFYTIRTVSHLTEIRAGAILFFDLSLASLGLCQQDEIALSVLTTIIGHHRERNEIICDAGWMALSLAPDPFAPIQDGTFGQVCDLTGNPISELKVRRVSQETGVLGLSNGQKPDWQKFPVGSQLRILPNDATATAAMYRRYAVCQGQMIEAFWPRINGW